MTNLDAALAHPEPEPAPEAEGLREAAQHMYGVLNSMTAVDQRAAIGNFISAINQALDEYAATEPFALADTSREVYEAGVEVDGDDLILTRDPFSLSPTQREKIVARIDAALASEPEPVAGHTQPRRECEGCVVVHLAALSGTTP